MSKPRMQFNSQIRKKIFEMTFVFDDIYKFNAFLLESCLESFVFVGQAEFGWNAHSIIVKKNWSTHIHCLIKVILFNEQYSNAEHQLILLVNS